MKDSEFTELLNLYLDHEISPADAARLEAEVQSNPARRRVYQEYCRMQKACKMLAQDFASDGEAPTDAKVIDFATAEPKRQGRTKIVFLSTAFAAAAACVAVVFINRTTVSTVNADAGSPVAVQTRPASEPKATQVAANDAAPTTARGIERRSADSLSLRNAGQSNAFALTANGSADPRFAWIQEVRLTPIQAPAQVDQLRFDNDPNLHPENRTYTSGNRPVQSELPGIAIRFQK